MAQVTQVPTRAANDGFERYYAEKLWEWIPEVYRDLDGRDPGAQPPLPKTRPTSLPKP